MTKEPSLHRYLENMIGEKAWGRYAYASLDEEEQLEGVPLAVGRTWVLVALTVDFHFDGFGLLKKSRIREIKRGNAFWTGIIAKEFAKLNLTRLAIPPLDNTPELIRYYAQTKDIVMVHMEEDADDFLYIGNFLKTNSRSFSFRCITTEAEWEDHPRHCLNKWITRIVFGSEYDRVYARHVTDPLGDAASRE